MLERLKKLWGLKTSATPAQITKYAGLIYTKPVDTTMKDAAIRRQVEAKIEPR